MIKFKMVLRWLRYNIVIRLLSFLPFPFAFQVVRIVGFIDSFVNAKDRIIYRQGIAKAFPALSSAELDSYWQKHCVMMAREQLDVFFLPRLSTVNHEQFIELQGFDVLQEAKREGKGIIMAMGHYGRPIMLCASLGASGSKTGMLTQTIDERNPHLNSVERSYLAKKMKNVVAASGGRWVMLDDSLRSMYAGLKTGETITILFDLHEPNPTNRLEAPFCGGTLGLPCGIVRIAERTGARIVYGVARDIGRRVGVELRSLPENPHEAFVAAVKELEKDVKAAPWQWWQWRMIDHIWTPPQKES